MSYEPQRHARHPRVIELSGFFKTVALGGATTLLSLVIVKSMAFVNSIIAARLLGPSDYGAYSVIFNLQSLATVVACFGIPLTLARYIAKHRGTDQETASMIGSYLTSLLVASSVVTASLYLVLAESIAVSVYGDRDLVLPMQLSSLLVLASSINLGMTSSVQGCKRIVELARTNAVVAITAQPISFIMILTYGLSGAFVALAISTSISVVLLVRVLTRVLPIHLSFHGHRRDANDRPILFSFIIPSFLSSLMIVPAYWYGRTILAIESDFDSVGIFQVAESLSQLMLLIPAAIGVPLLPLVSEMHARDAPSVGKSSRSLLSMVLLLVVPLAILAMPTLEWVITNLYGLEYRSAADTAVLMFASSTIVATSTVISTVMIGTGRMWSALGMNAIWASCFFVSAFILVPAYGSEGLGATYLLAHLAYVILLLEYFSHAYGTGTRAAWLPLTILLGYTLAFVLTVSSQGMLVSVMSSLVACVVAVAVTSKYVLSQSERRLVAAALRKGLRHIHS